MGPEDHGAVPITLPDCGDAGLDVVVVDSDSHSEEPSGMLDFVSFEGNDELLRGVKLSTVMKGAGEVFKNSEGSSDTYRLSQQVDSLGYFISHNWCIPRGAKFLALIFKFNLNCALLAVVLCNVVCCVAGICGWQPDFYASDADYHVSIFCRLFSVPSVLVGLCLGGMVVDFHHSPNVFLDKVCINQSSEEAQRAGIEKLGAFLRSSNRMLALYSHVYLSKLWTIFEVAGFLTMHGPRDLDLLPVMLPCVFMLILFGNWLYLSCHILWRIADFPVGISPLVTQLVIRQWTKHKAQIRMHLATFEVRKATCAEEDDRPVVYNNIAALLKAAGHVPKTATVEEALDVFDVRVRKLMASQFYSLFGTYAFSYKEYIILSLTNLAPCLLDYLGQIGNGAPWQEVLREHIFDVFWIFTGVPLWQMALEDGTSYGLALNGFAEAALMFLVVWGFGVIGTVTLYLTEYLGKRARTDDTLCYCCVAIVSVITLTSLIILPRKLSKSLRTRSSSQSSSSSSSSPCKTATAPSADSEHTLTLHQRLSLRSAGGGIQLQKLWGSEASTAHNSRHRCSARWLQHQPASESNRFSSQGLTSTTTGTEMWADRGHADKKMEKDQEQEEEEEEEKEQDQEQEQEYGHGHEACNEPKLQYDVKAMVLGKPGLDLFCPDDTGGSEALERAETVAMEGGDQADEELPYDLDDDQTFIGSGSNCSSEYN